MKTLLTAFAILAFSNLAFSAESYYEEAAYLLSSENCTGTYYKVKTDAQFKCEQEHTTCTVEDWGTATLSPVTNYSDIAQGWKYKCTVFAIAKPVKDTSEAYELGLGFGGSDCDSGSTHFNSLIMRLGFASGVHAYSRCVKSGIMIGLKTDSQPGNFKASTPIPFKNMETCLKYLKNDFEYTLRNSDAVSVGNRKFGLTLYCEPVGRKASLSGVVSLY